MLAIAFDIRGDLLVPAGNRLTFDLPDAMRPEEFGMDGNRMLGVKLSSISVDRAG